MSNMVTTPPSCIAANQDTVYYISPTTNGKNELALVKSSRWPVSLAAATWTFVSSTTSSSILTSNLWNSLQNSDCSVDAIGVFSMRFRFDSLLTGIRYDPAAPRSFQGSTNTPDNSTHGEWSTITLFQPTDAALWNPVVYQLANSIKDTLVLYQTKGDLAAPPSLYPTLLFANVQSDGSRIPVTNSDLVKLQLVSTSLTWPRCQYQSGCLFAVLKSSTCKKNPQH